MMTAIIVAGRSGSAFAAEIGTMMVNEEVDALVTMGFEPIRFLAVPKVMAAHDRRAPADFVLHVFRYLGRLHRWGHGLDLTLYTYISNP
jgi:phospholipid/cholesterol/gamma-HCH transport system permease protein